MVVSFAPSSTFFLRFGGLVAGILDWLLCLLPWFGFAKSWQWRKTMRDVYLRNDG